MDTLDHERIWSDTELEHKIGFALVHCARLGYEVWVELEHERFNTEMVMFDDNSAWLARPENRKPLSEEDWSQRRKLLSDLHDQFSRFISYIQFRDQEMRRLVAQ